MAKENYIDVFHQIKRPELSVPVMDAAIHLMFPNCFLKKSQFNELHNLMRERYKITGCVVFYDIKKPAAVRTTGNGMIKGDEMIERPFQAFCKKHGLNPGKREIIITPNQNIQYSADYHFSPRPWPENKSSRG